jgi:hypothetical protein
MAYPSGNGIIKAALSPGSRVRVLPYVWNLHLEERQGFDFGSWFVRWLFCCSSHGLNPLACSDSDWTSETMNPFRHFFITVLLS